MASSSISTASSLTSAITNTITKVISATASSSSPTATILNDNSAPSNGADPTYNGFPSKDLFFFVVIGIPVIAITAVSVFLGCCCCCKFSWKDTHRRRRERQIRADASGAPSKAVSPETSSITTATPEFAAPERVCHLELAGSAEEPPPKYDHAVKQHGQRDVDEPQLKYNFTADRQV